MNLFAIEENYADSVYPEFYWPNSVDPDIKKWKYTKKGEYDAGFALYSREGNQEINGDVDYYNITSSAAINKQY
jgi:hypothetical protein